MISKLCWLNFILITQSPCALSMCTNRIKLMQLNKIYRAVHIRNFKQHIITYKTPEGIIIKEHWDGTETRIYPDGTIIHIHPTPEIKTNQNPEIINFKQSLKKFFTDKK